MYESEHHLLTFPSSKLDEDNVVTFYGAMQDTLNDGPSCKTSMSRIATKLWTGKHEAGQHLLKIHHDNDFYITNTVLTACVMEIYMTVI